LHYFRLTKFCALCPVQDLQPDEAHLLFRLLRTETFLVS